MHGRPQRSFASLRRCSTILLGVSAQARANSSAFLRSCEPRSRARVEQPDMSKFAANYRVTLLPLHIPHELILLVAGSADPFPAGFGS